MPSGPEPQHIPVPGADLRLYREVPLGVAATVLLGELIEATPWQTVEIVLFGKRLPQPRRTAWYGDAGARYRYSGTTLSPLPWTPRLSDLRERIQSLTGSRCNSVLLNLYRDHRDSMGLHADDEPCLGSRPVIASLSLGATRVLRFKHRHDAAIPSLRLALPTASVLVMAGDTQTNWKHALPRQARPCGERLNLTFRWITPDR